MSKGKEKSLFSTADWKRNYISVPLGEYNLIEDIDKNINKPVYKQTETYFTNWILKKREKSTKLHQFSG